ncbi:MAG: VCBS repeat-containing protein, partial [Nitrospirales bacterium]|nr:VCBS repeat-containing protein [Nitrospirales bacterium]
MRCRIFNIYLVVFLLLTGWGWSVCHAQNIVFTPTASIPVGKAPQSITTGDFNGDSFLDLATVKSTSDDVSILLGNGNGTFQAPVSFGIGKIPMSVVTADVTGDGPLDLIVATSGSDRIVVMKGQGNGFFDRVGSFPSGKGTTFLALGDFNRDERADLVAVNSGRFGYYPPFNLSVLFNEGNGKFAAPVTYEAEGRNGMFPTGVLARDITGDGLTDLAVTWSQPSWRSPNGMISLLVNTGQGKFSLRKELNPAFTLSAIAGGDVDGNGYLDLITTSLYLDSVIVLYQDEEGEFLKLNPIQVG